MFLLMSMCLVAQVLRQDKIIIGKRWLGPRCSQQPYKYDNDNDDNDDDGDDDGDGNGDDDKGEDEKAGVDKVEMREWERESEMSTSRCEEVAKIDISFNLPFHISYISVYIFKEEN